MVPLSAIESALVLPILTAPVTPVPVVVVIAPDPMFGTVITAVEVVSAPIVRLLKAVVTPIGWRVIAAVPPSIVRLSPVPSAPSIPVVKVIVPSLEESLESIATVPLIFTVSLNVMSAALPS